MKKTISTLALVFACAMSTLAQLPPVAQTIYDSCVANNPGNVSYTLTNGAQVMATPDGNSFYVQWFPTGSIPNATPVIVTLHGSKGNAFNEFKSWHTAAQSHNCGIIAIQYNKYTDIFNYLSGYFQDDTIYSYIDSALTRISYPSHKALLHGFSLGSARSYAVIYNDIQSGNNYFCTTISNAGKIDLTYPLYNYLNTIPIVFVGKHWNLFCGPPEPPFVGGACDGLDFTKIWLQNKGAVVDIYIQDSLLGHNGFQLATSVAYKDTMLDQYLQCYNSTVHVNEISQESKTIIFPNPFSSIATLHSDKLLNNATLAIYNSRGEPVKLVQNISGKTIVIIRNDLPIGLYFYRLTDANSTLSCNKFVITE